MSRGFIMNSEINLEKRLYELRTSRSLNQKQLGEIVGLSHKAISTIESGSRYTTIEKLVQLARYFDVSTDYLLGLSDDPKRY